MIEFTHRSMTGICTGLTLTLIGWTFLATRPGTRVRKAAVWSGCLLFTEAILGAVLVLGGFVEHNTSNLRVLVQAVHFTNTLLLLAALGITWWWERPRPTTLTPSSSRSRTLALFALASVILTGATGSVAALADTLFPSPDLHTALLADFAAGSPLLVRMRWMHPAASVISLLLITALAVSQPQGRRTLLALLGLQFLLGTADVLTLAPLTLQVLHLFSADLLWIALVVVSAGVFERRADRVLERRPAVGSRPTVHA